MVNPKYLVKIKGKDFDCLGEQLISILNLIHADLKNVLWYASDIDVTTKPDFILKYRDSYPKKIGSTEKLIEIAKNVEQFLSGVFLAFPRDYGEILSFSFNTEDTPFRDMRDAFLEIRAFDTSYFEFYSNNWDLIHKIARGNYGIIEYNLEQQDEK